MTTLARYNSAMVMMPWQPWRLLPYLHQCVLFRRNEEFLHRWHFTVVDWSNLLFAQINNIVKLWKLKNVHGLAFAPVKRLLCTATLAAIKTRSLPHGTAAYCYSFSISIPVWTLRRIDSSSIMAHPVNFEILRDIVENQMLRTCYISIPSIQIVR